MKSETADKSIRVHQSPSSEDEEKSSLQYSGRWRRQKQRQSAPLEVYMMMRRYNKVDGKCSSGKSCFEWKNYERKKIENSGVC
jgi:hypothetical protein